MKQLKCTGWTTSPLLVTTNKLNLSIGDRAWVCDDNIIREILSFQTFTYRTKAGNIQNFNSDRVFSKLFDFLQWLDNRIENGDPSFIPINNSILVSFFGKWYGYYLDLLKELNILIRVPYDDGSWYKEEVRPCRYRITNHYKRSKQLSIVKQGGKKRVGLKIHSDLNIDRKFKKAIRGSDIDFSSFLIEEKLLLRKGEITFNQLRVRISQVLRTYQSRYIKKGKSVDRIFHSFSSVPRTARGHLISPYGQGYYELDIANCHPTLLIILLKSMNLGIDESYLNDVQTGNLYQRFIDVKGPRMKYDNRSNIRQLVDIRFANKNDVKPEFFSAILYDFKPKHPLAIKFRDLYPITYDSIQSLYTGEDSTLASQLQNLEASVFNGLKPKHSRHFFTLHDAIYFTDRKDYDALRKKISRSFKKHGIKVRQHLKIPKHQFRSENS